MPFTFHTILILLTTFWASIAITFADEPPITDIAFAPDGKSFVTVSQAGIETHSWPDLKPLKSVSDNLFPNLNSVCFSPGGKQIAVSGGIPAEQGRIAVFSWPEMKLTSTLSAHQDSIMSVVWRGDDQLLTSSLDRSAFLISIQSKKTALTFSGHSRGVTDACLLGDGMTLVTCGLDNSLRVWNCDDGKLIRNLNQHTQPVNAIALRPGDEGLPMVASASADRTIRFWQPTIGRMVRYVRLEAEPLDIAWLHDGQRIAAACNDGHVRIIDAANVTVLQDIAEIDGWAYAIAVHPSENAVLVAGTDGKIKRIDFENE
jgi:WD40 repeat protein